MSWFNAKCLLQITLSGSEWVNLNVPSSSCRHTISLILNYRGSKYTGRGLKMFAMFLPHVITVDTSQLSQSPHTDVITEYEVIYVNLLNAILFVSIISGTYIWANSKQPVTINRWSYGEPNGGTDQNCAGTYRNKFIDLICSNEHIFLCEFYN